ncbi:MAG TPA: dihydrodipicolinate synthase family protein, partial [Candidatus Aminicenantes bacterium]|nr:dihydrodipicolinate synthase family protein [Candidatus Aminicenantes bacterium]
MKEGSGKSKPTEWPRKKALNLKRIKNCPKIKKIDNFDKSWRNKVMEKRFKGVFAPLTTPFINGQIAADKLRDNIEKFNRTGLAGYIIMGSTGEAPFVDDEEAELLVREATRAASPEKIVIAGTGRDSAEWTIKLTNRLAEAGAQAALIKPPYYYKSRMNYEALKAYYSEVADRVKIPVIMYNIPQNTQIWLPLELVIELAKHQNIIGLKESGGS